MALNNRVGNEQIYSIAYWLDFFTSKVLMLNFFLALREMTIKNNKRTTWTFQNFYAIIISINSILIGSIAYGAESITINKIEILQRENVNIEEVF